MTYRARRGTFTPVAVLLPCQKPSAVTVGGFRILRGVFLAAVFTPDGLNQLLTTAQAASLFGVTSATIRKWDQLGKVSPAGLDRSGRKLYRLIDVARYEKETRVRSGRENREKRLGLRIPA